MLPLWGDSLRIVLTAPRGHSNLAWGNAPGKTGETPSRLKALLNNAPNFTLARFIFDPRMNANERE